VLTAQFAQVGIPTSYGKIIPLSHDGPGVYESYATGRVNINRLWVEIRTQTRHDLIALLVESIAGGLFDLVPWEGDVAEIVIEPSAEWEGFTWAVVKKSQMRKLREGRYDLVCCQ
jgi:PAT complex subunit CCDC47